MRSFSVVSMLGERFMCLEQPGKTFVDFLSSALHVGLCAPKLASGISLSLSLSLSLFQKGKRAKWIVFNSLLPLMAPLTNLVALPHFSKLFHHRT